LELRDRILNVLKRQFSLSSPGDSGLSFDDFRMGALEEWDSLGNLNLLLEIEKEFSVRFKTEELSSIQSLVEIEAFLADRTDTKSGMSRT
jgi:acyl carrier protein